MVRNSNGGDSNSLLLLITPSLFLMLPAKVRKLFSVGDSRCEKRALKFFMWVFPAISAWG
jgi:hypothetical protein